MIRVDLPALIERLNTACRQGLEEAASLCISQRGAEVTVPHMFFKLLDNPLCDIRLVIRQAGLDVDAMRQALSGTFSE